MARGVRTQYPEPLLADDADELLLDLCPRLVDLGEPAGGEDEIADPLFGAFAKRPGGGRRRKDDDCQVAVGRQAGCRGQDVDPQDRSPLRVDGVQRPGIAVGKDVPDHFVSGFSGDGGGADDRHAAGCEEGGERVVHALSPRVRCLASCR